MTLTTESAKRKKNGRLVTQRSLTNREFPTGEWFNPMAADDAPMQQHPAARRSTPIDDDESSTSSELSDSSESSECIDSKNSSESDNNRHNSTSTPARRRRVLTPSDSEAIDEESERAIAVLMAIDGHDSDDAVVRRAALLAPPTAALKLD